MITILYDNENYDWTTTMIIFNASDNYYDCDNDDDDDNDSDIDHFICLVGFSKWCLLN